MQALDGLKKRAVQGAAGKLVDSKWIRRQIIKLDGASDDQVISFVRKIAGASGLVAPFSAKAKQYSDQLAWVADSMSQPGSPAMAIVKRIFQLNPKSREKFLLNLVGRGTILGGVKREEVMQERGFAPFFAVISPTMKCNLRCANCYAWNFERGPILPFKVMSKICDDLEKVGCGFITITGGEPYLYEDPVTHETIWDLFEAHPNIFFQTYTNGWWLANDQAIEKMLALGNIAPAISVEGFEEETVARRSKPAWDKIMLAMRLMREAKLPFAFSATVTRDNVDRITTDAFVDFWIDQGCLYGWTFILIPMGSADIGKMLLPHQRDRLREFTTIYCRKTKPLMWFDFWNDGCLVDGCIAGGRHCHILNDGRVEACVFSPFVPRGFNVNDRSIMDILEEARYFQLIRQFQSQDERRRNPLMPCMVIDHPGHLAEAVLRGDAEPAYPGAEELVTPQMTRRLVMMAKAYRQYSEAALQKYGWSKAVKDYYLIGGD